MSYAYALDAGGLDPGPAGGVGPRSAPRRRGAGLCPGGDRCGELHGECRCERILPGSHGPAVLEPGPVLVAAAFARDRRAALLPLQQLPSATALQQPAQLLAGGLLPLKAAFREGAPRALLPRPARLVSLTSGFADTRQLPSRRAPLFHVRVSRRGNGRFPGEQTLGYRSRAAGPDRFAGREARGYGG